MPSDQGPKPVPVNWEEIILAMETFGFSLEEIATTEVHLSPHTLAKRAIKDLKDDRPDLLARWRKVTRKPKGPVVKKIEWARLIGIMERQGLNVHDAGKLVGLAGTTLGMRATDELKNGDPDLYRRWRKVTRLNAFPAPEHGTPQAYARHYHQGEKPCEQCKEGKAADGRLERWERDQDGTVQYKVTKRWSKKQHKEVYLVERFGGGPPTIVASYITRGLASGVAKFLNQEAFGEVLYAKKERD